MMWGRRTKTRTEPILGGLDVNASRVRGALGPAGLSPAQLPLDNALPELAMALSLEGRTPTIGAAALRQRRTRPHQVCDSFLPRLGQPQVWSAGRHRLDAAQALSLIFARLPAPLARAQGVAAVLPPYLQSSQVALLIELAGQARLPLVACVAMPLAAASAYLRQQPWAGLTVVLDVDEHALTWAVVRLEEKAPTLVLAQFLAYPRLGLRVWMDRLLDAVAERCIQQCRRDPRDCPEAEQGLFEQLHAILESGQQRRAAAVAIQTPTWHQHLILQPEEREEACAALVRAALDGMWATLAAARADSLPSAVLTTTAAAKLPGLLKALGDHCGAQAIVTVLPPDALVHAAHQLAVDVHQGLRPAACFEREFGLLQSAAETRVQHRHTSTHPDIEPPKPEDDFSIFVDE